MADTENERPEDLETAAKQEEPEAPAVDEPPAEETAGDAEPAAGVATAEDAEPVGDAAPETEPAEAGESAESDEPAEEKKPKKKHSKGFWAAVIVVALVAFFGVAYGVYIVVARNFMDQEAVTRDAWKVDTGELSGTNEDTQVNIYDADVESDMSVLQIQPVEVEDEGFTYYDEDVQARLLATVEELITDSPEGSWEADAPLAILNPYGTGSNGLYLYFETDFATQVSYVISTEGYDDYSATASGGYSQTHEIQIIGLVPGETNHVTMTMTGEQGVTRQIVEFDITMPETQSGYTTQLEYEDGESTQELSDGLYVMLRTNGYLGYGFFFDNSGTLRYEMVLEGMGMDRIVEYEGDIVTCVSDSKIARITSTGYVADVYDLGEYVLHHDINEGEDGTLIIAAEHSESDEGLIEDLVLELDLETGEFYELIDFSEFMSDFREEFTRVIGLTDDMAYMAGSWDWIHINTVQYVAEDDALIVSSRETSTIIKVNDIHDDPEIAWFVGNPDVWEGTGYEDYLLETVGDFTYQYGQHTVEYAGAGDEDGVYYLRLYDNNFWSISTRDDVDDVELEDSVYDTLYGLGGENSNVYVYKIDENEGTVECVLSFEVPYSSIVSSASPSDVWTSYKVDNQDEVYDMSGKNWIVNSGVSMVFGEYDEDGTLIRQFSYDADMQGYRTIKYTFEGFWFAEEE